MVSVDVKRHVYLLCHRGIRLRLKQWMTINYRKSLSFEAYHGHTHWLVYSDMLYLKMCTTGGVDVPCKN